MWYFILTGAVVLANAAAIPAYPNEVEPADMNTILRAVGAPPCMRECIDPLMGNLSSIWNMRDLANDTQKICRSHDEAISCLKKNQFCDLQGVFAKAASPLRHRCATQAALFKEVEPCLTPNMDSVVQIIKKLCFAECDSKCFARSNLTKFAAHDAIKKAASYGGNVFIVMEHIGDLCGSLKCLLPCITNELNAVCRMSGWATLDALMQPLEAVSLMVDGMNPVLKNIIVDKMDSRCQLALNSTIQKDIRKGDLSVLLN